MRPLDKATQREQNPRRRPHSGPTVGTLRPGASVAGLSTARDAEDHHVVVGTAGHIDHGKSALVHALTGVDPDRLKEEKARGITIDLGFAHCRIGNVTISLVDVPGHERFVRNMLAGASGVDALLLVVAADESVMPQTREHFAIGRLLGVREGLIALTKCDLADRDMRALARLEIGELVAGSFLERAPLLEVSSKTGEGLDELRHALEALGPRTVRGTDAGPARLPIDRAFTMRGFGTVVTGTLVSGSIAADAVLTLLPANRSVRVRGVQTHGASVAMARAGQRVAVNLGDVEVADLTRGDVLAAAGAFEPTRVIDARLETLEDAPSLRHGARVRFHQGTREVMARVAVSRLLQKMGGDDKGRAGEDVAAVPAAALAHVRLRLEAPAVVTRGDRFVLRSYSPVHTIAGGVVLDPRPRRARLRTASAHARFDALDDDAAGNVRAHPSSVRACRFVLDEHGRAGMSLDDFSRRLGLTVARRKAVVDELVGSDDALIVGERMVSRRAFDRAAEELLALVAATPHGPLESEGVPRQEARDRLKLSARVFDALVEGLQLAGRLAGRERLVLPGASTALSAERETLERVERALRQGGLTPPEAGEIAAQLSLDASLVSKAIAALGREHRVVRLGSLAFHADALEELKRRLRQEVDASGQAPADRRIDVGIFKARFGLTRKFAIPLLEYLDRERVTRRVGDARVVL
jgi:selenocysteine-specific elongation factor